MCKIGLILFMPVSVLVINICGNDKGNKIFFIVVNSVSVCVHERERERAGFAIPA